MKYRAFAKRRDLNEPEIVKGLLAAGYSVVRLDQPCDLLVGGGGMNWLLEVKNPSAARGKKQAVELTPTEEAFHATWKGQIAIVTNLDEAIRALNP